MEEEKEITTRGRGFSMIQAFKRAQNQPGSSQDSGDAVSAVHGSCNLCDGAKLLTDRASNGRYGVVLTFSFTYVYIS